MHTIKDEIDISMYFTATHYTKKLVEKMVRENGLKIDPIIVMAKIGARIMVGAALSPEAIKTVTLEFNKETGTMEIIGLSRDGEKVTFNLYSNPRSGTNQ